MKMLPAFTLVVPALLLGCTSSPRSQDMVRRSTAAVTRTVASGVKGAALGIRDGLRHDPNNDPIDVNSAPKDLLQTLPGVTSALADRIIKARPYGKPADLVRRHIVSKAVYRKVAPRLIAH